MSFGYYKAATINHLQCGASDSSNFPVCLNITDADFATVANGGKAQNSSGFDIRPFSDATLSTALTFELVFYSATTGQIEMWVKQPTLSHTADGLIYLAVGDPSISTDGSSNTTWDTNYKGVYHLKDGTTLSGADSSQSGATMTNTNGAAGAGLIDGGVSLNGTTAYLSTTNNALNANGTAVTVSGWANVSAYAGSGDHDLISRWNMASATDYQWVLSINNAAPHTPYFAINRGALNTTSSLTFATGASGVAATTWVYLVGVNNGTNAILYVNGASAASGTGGTIPSGTALDTMIGADNKTSLSNQFAGVLDEIRISTAVRSADWITAEYNNQQGSSTFLAWGSLTVIGSGLLLSGVRNALVVH